MVFFGRMARWLGVGGACFGGIHPGGMNPAVDSSKSPGALWARLATVNRRFYIVGAATFTSCAAARISCQVLSSSEIPSTSRFCLISSSISPGR